MTGGATGDAEAARGTEGTAGDARAGGDAGVTVSEAEAGAVAEGTVAGGAESGAIVLVGESPAKSSGSGLPAVRDREADAALERVPVPALEQALDRDAAPVLDRDRDLVGGVRSAPEEASSETEGTQPEAKEAPSETEETQPGVKERPSETEGTPPGAKERSSDTGGVPPGGGTAAASGRGPDTETPAEGYSAEVGTVCTAIRIN